ncbi:type II toxin-antitoxin system PemK/MazF family toxin [Synoicihabitans lomoniglobus]|uniref:Type II toxin-antitoxin system PemK/MazF family toxin n=1 Tax=Synoicihabitans lomoniglobus TaxID=2909285 RepID=A0AAF0CGW1_9BACT|nr:type II toxin-antitoxin system PemK/MazF family toxin [Opitutaceae bacterium LMO-M01]WED63782.1 type II toxin-antitoxin system PemK/MazF family toxin [Opitutaceae bacterium LMO-M01]
MPSATFEPGTLVVVPFPFTDSATTKRRPAVVLSSAAFNSTNGHVILAMITTAKHSSWTGDMPIRDWKKCGLPQPCIVRPKVFTLDLRFVERALGKLTPRDAIAFRSVINDTVMNHWSGN